MDLLTRDYIERQGRRQVGWLKESWLWLLRTRVLAGRPAGSGRPSALDVGCGPGHVMDALSGDLAVRGVDRDPEMVASCSARGLEAAVADAGSLPFPDGSFDVVYCSFLLLWVRDPERVVREMARVSRGWVLALSEPDYGGRIDHPEGLRPVGELMAASIRSRGGDPLVGRRLQGMFSACGLTAETGVHPGVWDLARNRQEFEDEWKGLEVLVGGRVPQAELSRLRVEWRDALDRGTAFQYSPIFYALGLKLP